MSSTLLESEWARIRAFRKFAQSTATLGLEPSVALAVERTYDVLPSDLFRDIRKRNMVEICDHINCAYYHGIYNGALVLMRKLLEALLIIALGNGGEENIIKEGNHYVRLGKLIKIAIGSTKLALSQNASANLGHLVKKGHLAAHNIFYSAKKSDIDKDQESFRQIVEELMHKAGLL